jgi:hypothetical protein
MRNIKRFDEMNEAEMNESFSGIFINKMHDLEELIAETPKASTLIKDSDVKKMKDAYEKFKETVVNTLKGKGFTAAELR